MPKISIITTTYKHQDFIAQAIESVLAQTYSDRELLIGDDSPDNATWNIIKKYVKKYPDKIKAWKHAQPKWLVKNMQFLVDNADNWSKYTAFLEGDDMYTPDNLQKKVAVFEQYSKVGIVTSGTEFCDKMWRKKKNIYLFSPEFYAKLWLSKYTVKGMFRKLVPPVRSFGNVMMLSAFNNIILDLDTWPYTDKKMFITFDLLIRSKLFPKTVIYVMEEKLFIYRQHDENNSSPAHFKEWLEQTMYVYNLYTKNFPKECDYLTKLISAKIFALTGEYKKSLNALYSSIKIFPFSHVIYKISILLDILHIKSFAWNIIKKISHQ